MCEVVVFSPEGQRWPVTFLKQELLKMTVRCFIEELVKRIVALYVCSEYTKDFRLIFGNKSLDDYAIKSGTSAQKFKEVNEKPEESKTAVRMLRRANGEPTVVEMLREVNGGVEKSGIVVQMVVKVNGG